MKSPHSPDLPFIIVGQGLAGSVLAWIMHQAQLPIRIFEGAFPGSASAAAAGLVTPITGKRWKISHKLGTLLPEARTFYQSLEKELETLLWENRTILRIFKSVDDKRCYEGRTDDPAYQPYLGKLHPPHTFGNDSLGSIELIGGGMLRVCTLLEALRSRFNEAKITIENHFDFTKLSTETSPMTYAGQGIAGVIFCEGAQVIHNPFFKDLPYQPSRGEILTIQSPMPKHPCIFNDGEWLVSLDSMTCRVGATYDWELNTNNTTQAKAYLLSAFKRLAPQNSMPVLLEQKLGIRLSLPDRLPVLGKHPSYSGIYLFNGFASKGSLFVPSMAQNLLNYIQGVHEAIPEEVNLARFLK